MHFKFKIDESNHIVFSSNKGMELEDEINETNDYYRRFNIALIYKKPTPIKIVKCKDNKISEAYFLESSTTDYNGVYKGKYIDFEAKETSSKTSLPLANIQPNQIEHIENVLAHSGIAFLIISFTSLGRYFLLTGETFLNFLREKNKKSISLNFLEKNAFEIKREIIPPLNYIKILEKIYEF